MDPIIIGGNGHSGTRLFAEILIECDVFMGIAGISYARDSKDLNIRGLMNRWVKPYLLGLSEKDTVKMKSEFERRIRFLLPFRSKPWGFKNPRSMFLLPMYWELYPNLKFIHVIRDGRDMCFGNPFVDTPTYWSFISEEDARLLSPEERMMKFWGTSNRRVQDFGNKKLRNRYLPIRFEDICDHPESEIRRIQQFINSTAEDPNNLARLVKKPKSIGRWRTFDPKEVEKVLRVGDADLKHFGYL